jgi:hypothetical protein
MNFCGALDESTESLGDCMAEDPWYLYQLRVRLFRKNKIETHATVTSTFLELHLEIAVIISDAKHVLYESAGYRIIEKSL